MIKSLAFQVYNPTQIIYLEDSLSHSVYKVTLAGPLRLAMLPDIEESPQFTF